MTITLPAAEDNLSQRAIPGEKRTRINALDGVRGLAIAIVTSHHLISPTSFAGHPWIRAILDHGWLGVQAFFVLSGFLITSILRKELANKGSIDLKAFYARRCYRLLPAFYTYIAVLLALVLLKKIDVPIVKLATARARAV